MSWTDERVDLLKKLWMEGLSASQIANELGEGVTRNAVIGKVHRLKLSARAKPASSSPRPRSASRSSVRRAASSGGVAAGMKRRILGSSSIVGATALKPTRDYAADAEPELVEVQELYIPEAERKSLLDLNEHTCKWPIGDPLNPDFHFCGRPSREDGPYCEFHARRAYHQVDKKRR
jgi:GcrA cell cycle regulator